MARREYIGLILERIGDDSSIRGVSDKSDLAPAGGESQHQEEREESITRAAPLSGEPPSRRDCYRNSAQ